MKLKDAMVLARKKKKNPPLNNRQLWNRRMAKPGARERKRAQNKRWYDNTRADPAKWRAYLDRKAENERARRARCAPTPTSEVTA